MLRHFAELKLSLDDVDKIYFWSVDVKEQNKCPSQMISTREPHVTICLKRDFEHLICRQNLCEVTIYMKCLFNFFL